MMKHFLTLALLLGAGLLGCRSTRLVREGALEAGEMDRLIEFANARGLDLNSEVQRICASNTNSLAKVLRFSQTFTNFDGVAADYGRLIYGTLLTRINMGAREEYAVVLAAQDSEVKQRVRDFLYYSAIHDTSKRALNDRDVRNDFPDIFPEDYARGRDPLFQR